MRMLNIHPLPCLFGAAVCILCEFFGKLKGFRKFTPTKQRRKEV